MFIDHKVQQDPQILKDLVPWRAKVEAIGSTVVGETMIELDRDSCRDQECTLGVLYADGFADQVRFLKNNSKTCLQLSHNLHITVHE